MTTAPRRHKRIVREAERLAGECYIERVDPTPDQVYRTVAERAKIAPDAMNGHDRLVAWQAYRERFVDHDLGRYRDDERQSG